MRLDRLATLAVAHPLQSRGVLPCRPAVPVLMYHSISGDPESRTAPYFRLATSLDRFRRQMYLLRDHGYRVTGLAEPPRPREGLPDGAPGRAVVLTFDDGYLDFLTDAWPVLSELRFTATVFLPTAFIGAARRRFKDRPCLTWSEVRALFDGGVSFGSHTVSHPVLQRMPWPEVRRELRESRDQIEDALGAPVTTFAYPYAFPQEDRSFSDRFRKALIDERYEAGVTTVIGRLSSDADRLRIKRLPINDCDDEALFLAKLAGAYDWMGTLQGGWRRAKQMVSGLRGSA